MKKPNIHVVHRGGKWAVEEEGAADYATSFGTRDLAIQAARQVKADEVELIVHRIDDSVSAQTSHQNELPDVVEESAQSNVRFESSDETV